MVKKSQKGGTHVERLSRERGAGKSKRPGAPDGEVFGEDFLTPDEMRDWAHREIRAAARASDMRTRQLLDLVADYSAGKITPEKADELQSLYYHRWGDALPAHLGDPPRTDEQLLAAIDKVRGQFVTPREAFDYVRSTRTPPGGGKSR